MWRSDTRTVAGWLLERKTRAPSVAATVNCGGLREEGRTEKWKCVLMNQEERRGKTRL